MIRRQQDSVHLKIKKYCCQQLIGSKSSYKCLQTTCKFWSFSQGGVLLSWHCLWDVGIPSDHKLFAGHFINYEPEAFSAVNDKEAARFCSSQNQKHCCQQLIGSRSSYEHLQTTCKILVILARWCLALLVLPVVCKNTIRS
jgi:hypothetical protein